MKEIGSIKQIQIQRSSLKLGEKPYRYYNPAPLLIVKQLLLSPQGVIGVTEQGRQIIDVHHANHPTSRHKEGINGISFGFTSHYQAVREYFGPHLYDGIAGENILVETDQQVTLADIEHGIAVQSNNQIIYLKDLMVAAPCIEFSQFAINESTSPSNSQIKGALQFLHDGRRGFYATLVGEQQPAFIQAGDKVFALNSEH